MARNLVSLLTMDSLVSAVRQAVPNHMRITYDQLEEEHRHVFVVRQGMRGFTIKMHRNSDGHRAIRIECFNLELVDVPALMIRQIMPPAIYRYEVEDTMTITFKVRHSVDDEQLQANVRRVLHPFMCMIGHEE